MIGKGDGELFTQHRVLNMLREAGFWRTAFCTVPVIGYSAIGSSFSWMPVFAAVWLCLLLWSGMAWRSRSRPLERGLLFGEAYTFRFRRALMTAFLAMVLLSVPTTRWPLRLSLLAAQPALNAIADRLERGETVQMPCRAGLFHVCDARLSQVIGWDGDVLVTKQIPCIWFTDYNASPDAVGFSRVPLGDCAAWQSGKKYICSVSASHVSGKWFQLVKY